MKTGTKNRPTAARALRENKVQIHRADPRIASRLSVVALVSCGVDGEDALINLTRDDLTGDDLTLGRF